MSRHPIGKPVKIIPMGDVPAALEWVGYAKKRAWELLGMQGTWQRKVIHPNADTVIRIETLAGIPRVTIEVNGVDYVCSFQGAGDFGDPELSQSLWTGRLFSGTAQVRGKAPYGAGSSTNLLPVGDGVFLAGPPKAGQVTTYVQYITTRSGVPNGSGFNPWNPPIVPPPSTIGPGPAEADYGIHESVIKDVGGSGIYLDTNGYTYKRLHILYRYARMPVGYMSAKPDGETITSNNDPIHMPAIMTSYDDGVSFNLTQFYINLTQYYPGFLSLYPVGNQQADFQPIDIVFFGNNTLAIYSYTHGSGYTIENGFSGVAGDPTIVGQYAWELYGVHTLLSQDGGQTWTSHHTSYQSLELLDASNQPTIGEIASACFVGGSTVIATTKRYLGPDIGNPPFVVWRSTDYGQTWAVVTLNAGVTPPGFEGLTPLCEHSAGYVAYEFATMNPARIAMHRTVDDGSTWQVYALPDGLISVQPGSLVVREVLSAPSPLPPDKVPCDYIKLAVIAKRAMTTDTPNPPWQLYLSDDGGKNWYAGGIVSTTIYCGRNVGIVNPALPPYPGYPDIHKNGLTVP